MPPPSELGLASHDAGLPVPYRVARRQDETPDTVTLALEPTDPLALGGARPGQFNMLFAFGVGEVPISVSGVDGTTILHTIRAVGAVTSALAASPVGAVVGVRGPFGTEWSLDSLDRPDVVLVAGGIGLAPLRSAARAVLGARERFGRVAVLVGARSDDTLLFAAELESWREHDLQVRVTVDWGGPHWRGHVGVVTGLLPGARFEPERTLGLICGPEVMIRRAAGALVDAGLDPERIQVSVERNMQCGIGHCGHCQLGPFLLCRDGPVVPWSHVSRWLSVAEL